MKISTIGIVVVVSVAMIGAALAYHFLIKSPAEAPVERSVAQNSDTGKSDQAKSDRSERSDNQIDAGVRSDKSSNEIAADNQANKSAVRGIINRSGEIGRKETRRSARLTEDPADMSNTSRPQMDDSQNRIQGGAELPRDVGSTPVLRPKFDVIRVAPDGVSVFAGQAEPGTSVVVILNGRSIGESVANSEGAWSVVTVITEHHKDMELILQARRGSEIIAEIEKPVIVERIIVAEVPRPAAKSVSSRTKPASENKIQKSVVSSKTAKKIRVLDEKTVIKKVEEKENRKIALGPKIDPPKKTAEGKPIIVETKQEGVTIASPVPINFVYREAIFTDDGKKAVASLLEFVMKKKLNKITLSGHTDERGTEEFNMTLSEDRLVAVSTFLRSHGFTGDIVLRPMGEIRPMQLRNSEGYSQEEIWQFNRRVELEGSE